MNLFKQSKKDFNTTIQPPKSAQRKSSENNLPIDTKPLSKFSTYTNDLGPIKYRKRWRSFKIWFLDIGQVPVTIILLSIFVISFLSFQVGGLTNGISADEQTYIASVDSGKELMDNPTFILHKLPTYILFKINVQRVAFYRMIGVFFTATVVISGFYILRRWFTLRIALLGSWLLLTSAWLLHIARIATPESTYLLIMPLLWVAVWMYNTPKRKLALLALLFLSCLSLYIPGFIWLVLGAIIWQSPKIYRELSKIRIYVKVGAIVTALVLLIPLFYASYKTPIFLLEIAGLPSRLPNISELYHNLINIPLNIFIQGPDNPSMWLGRIPYLDVASSVLLLLGIYSLRYKLSLIRTQLVIGSGMLLTILISIGGIVSIASLIPLLYILIAGGIGFMLQQWYTVFPNNPVARSLASTSITVLILLISFYNINHYFIAWPKTPATKSSFGHSLLK